MKFRKIMIATLALAPLALALAQNVDDAYRDARRLLNRQEFPAAIRAFRDLRRDFPDSRFDGDSLYWEAFSLERNGELERAVAVVDELLREHPEASTANDARALRLQVCSSLAARGDGECAEAVSSSVRDPSQLDPATRMAAVNALLNMRADRAVTIASGVATNRNQPQGVRRQALFVLADKAEEAGATADAQAVLRSVALDESDDHEVRAQAVFWLSEVPGDDVLETLTEILTTVTDRELKNRAIFAIAQHDDPRAMAMLREYATDADRDTETRKQAIFWIGEEGAGQALPFLTSLYAELANAELKQQVLFAVSETGASGAADWLLERARDAGEPAEVRKRALFWAAESGLTLQDLDGLYRSFEDPELRENVIWLMSEHGGRDSLDALLEIARNDPDARMREKAVFWIGDSDDPRAADYLLELIGE